MIQKCLSTLPIVASGFFWGWLAVSHLSHLSPLRCSHRVYPLWMRHFTIPHSCSVSLSVSIYVLGYVIGPLIFGSSLGDLPVVDLSWRRKCVLLSVADWLRPCSKSLGTDCLSIPCWHWWIWLLNHWRWGNRRPFPTRPTWSGKFAIQCWTAFWTGDRTDLWRIYCTENRMASKYCIF